MAVYTPVSDADLNAFLADYALGAPLALEGIAEGVENSNFRLLTERGRYILTIYEKRVDPADLPFFLGLMEHLARHGLPCPLPVHARDGAALRRLAGKPAAIVSCLEGRWPRRITVEHCAALGEALAAAASGHRRLHPHPPQRPLARRLAHPVRRLPRQGGCGRARAGGRDRGRARPPAPRSGPTDLPAGVIHADLFPDNVFFAGDRVTGIIDFYFACNDLLAYDVAICLNAWCFERRRRSSTSPRPGPCSRATAAAAP